MHCEWQRTRTRCISPLDAIDRARLRIADVPTTRMIVDSARLTERKTGSTIDPVDDGHVLNRVLRCGLYRFSAQHRCGEGVKLIVKGATARKPLHPLAVG